jgi:Holliday junction resolvase
MSQTNQETQKISSFKAKGQGTDFDNDLLVDNLLKEGRKKGINGCRKGKTVERNLCKFLTEKFQAEFTRSVGSGNRWGQVELPEYAKQVFTGDICVPEGFKWVIESKGGYEDKLDLNNVCDGPITQLDDFIEQVSRDAEYCGRKPIVLWKRNRKPWIAVVRKEHIMSESVFPYLIRYGDWRIVSFDELLKNTDRNFWFEVNK